MSKRTNFIYKGRFNESLNPTTMRTVVMDAAGFQTKIKRIGNSEYQVFPAVLLVEGVHQGAGSDPVFYSQALLEAVAPMWNNIPVTIGHPVDTHGNYIMVNHDGTVQQQWTVGHVMNAHYEDGKLKAEVWINQSKVSQLAPGLIDFLTNGGQLEVSTGLLSQDDGQAGNWNGEEYTSTLMEIVPDHFALLPGGRGACSWEDGCGIRWNVNKQHQILFNSADLQQTVEKVRALVDAMDEWDQQNETYRKMHYVRAVFSDYFIYQQNVRQQDKREEKMVKQQYSLDTDNNIVLEGEPIEVIEEITYKVKANEEGTLPINVKKKKENKMAVKTNGSHGCCEKRIDALIANEDNAFVVADKDWLSAMNEGQIEKLEAIVKVEVPGEQGSKANVREEPTTLAGWLETVPGEIRSVVNAGLKELDSKRASIIGKITANEKNSFTEDQLKGMDMSMLESISNLLPQSSTDFGARVPAEQVNSSQEEAYIPRTLSDSLGKKK